MPAESGPWDARWETTEELGGGGQGTTYKVKSKSDPERIGVLKVLNAQAAKTARARMHREVTALQTLSTIDIKVPKVLDGNTAEYEQPSTKLFFVMSFVAGQTLKKVIDTKRRLSVEGAAALTIDLCDTVAKAHAAQVVHRDLKPENIIVRDLDPADAVIVDLGLSYQDEAAETVTQVGERMRNKFLVLPELNTSYGEHRDPRSDITALAGLFYYCLTGREPGMPRNAAGEAIHRAPGMSVREILASDPRVFRVESFLDRGLAYEIDQRFPTCAEFKARLTDVLKVANPSLRDPIVVGRAITDRLMRQDRKTQLSKMSAFWDNLRMQLLQALHHIGGQLPDFTIAIGQSSVSWKYPDVEFLPDILRINVGLNAHGTKRVAYIGCECRAAECVLLGAVIQEKPNNNPIPFESWEKLLWFTPSLVEANKSQEVQRVKEQVEPLVRNCLAEAIQQLGEEALRPSPAR